MSGSQGQNVLLQVSGGYIQWQHEGDANWQDLVDVSALQGPQGYQGLTGNTGRCV